jgi:hypothetical protein
LSISRGPDGKPVLFQDLPKDHFPVLITAFIGDEQIWERTILPYVAVSIPPASEEDMGKISIRVRYANGIEIWERAPKG